MLYKAIITRKWTKEEIYYFRRMKHKTFGTHVYVVRIVADIFHAQVKSTVHQLSQCVDCFAGSLEQRHDDGGI